MFKWLYIKGTVNIGNGDLYAKKNRITGKVTLLLCDSAMSQSFKSSNKSLDK